MTKISRRCFIGGAVTFGSSAAHPDYDALDMRRGLPRVRGEGRASPAAELQFRGGAAGRAGASRTPPEPDGEGLRILRAVRLALEALPGRGHCAA